MDERQQRLLREEMITNRSFLLDLYNSQMNVGLAESFINGADENQLTMLCKVLNALASGEIPMRHADVRLIGRKRLMILHSKFKETYLYSTQVSPCILDKPTTR
jgi:hypothetical protein